MEMQTFAYAYLTNELACFTQKIAYEDPVGVLREVKQLLNEHQPKREEEAVEPEHELSLVYRSDEDFKIKGCSYFLFTLFVQNLIQWYWAPDGDPFEAKQAEDIKQLLVQLNNQIEHEDLEFDTDVTWSITCRPKDDTFVIKVATRRWSAKMLVLKY